jgi:uncharacterized protein YehS (DUF1456 family)
MLVISSRKVSNYKNTESLEFILDDNLKVVNFVQDNALYELNHVRVNPKINNDKILQKLRVAIQSSGVDIYDLPTDADMRMLYKPIGEISSPVRFYLQEDKSLCFLSSAVKLQIVR